MPVRTLAGVGAADALAGGAPTPPSAFSPGLLPTLDAGSKLSALLYFPHGVTPVAWARCCAS